MKKRLLKVSLASMLATNLLMTGALFIPPDGVAFATETESVQRQVQQVNGKITNISQKAKTIAISKPDGSFFLFEFNDDTLLKGIASPREFSVDEAIVVNYIEKDGENIAITLEKAFIKLPEGVTEIKTEELVELLESKQDIVIVDSRPLSRYDEGHIKSSVSIPFSTLTTMGESGSQLLKKHAGKQLIFYCGGPT